MQILMFGWEFPPRISGGLGTACYGMTRALIGRGHEILFVQPVGGTEPLCGATGPVSPSGREATAFPKGLTLHAVHSPLRPYPGIRTGRLDRTHQPASCLSGPHPIYADDLIGESVRFGKTAGVIARERRFDVIHAHDWMTVFAGIEARAVSGCPLVLHIHSLEFDRSGENIHRDICQIERLGLEQADQVIAVSHYTRSMIVDRYGTDPAKVAVVHNALVQDTPPVDAPRRDPACKTVLFLGRITFQKGPEYFVEAAARVLRELPEVTFVMAGAGDLMPQMMDLVAERGIGKNFHFTGFLTGDEVESAYRSSDLYVMPSVSEPFGIAPLEALHCDVPVIISRQSGVSEVLHHVLKVDFWNVTEMADKIIAVLRHPALAEDLTAGSREDLRRIQWEIAAVQIENIYRSLLPPARERAP